MNKEFEQWKHTSSLGKAIIDDYSDLGYTELTEGQVQEIYETGQRLERDKHQFIPVDTRLPTENDGTFIDKEHTSIDVLCKTDMDTKIVAVYRFSDKQFFYDTKITFDMINITDNIVAWKSLIEE